jgi:hypothetical protein
MYWFFVKNGGVVISGLRQACTYTAVQFLPSLLLVLFILPGC